MDSILFDTEEQTASAFFYFASRRIPPSVQKMYSKDAIDEWVQNVSLPLCNGPNSAPPCLSNSPFQTTSMGTLRALLLTHEKKVPLLWKVLANRYGERLVFGSHRDRKGKTSSLMGIEAGRKQSKVLVYQEGTTTPISYRGLFKLEHLKNFFDSVLDDERKDIQSANEKAANYGQKYEPTAAELEEEQNREAERLKLAHGGFAEFVDFEKVVKEGHAASFHGSHGFGEDAEKVVHASHRAEPITPSPIREEPSSRTPPPSMTDIYTSVSEVPHPTDEL